MIEQIGFFKKKEEFPYTAAIVSINRCFNYEQSLRLYNRYLVSVFATTISNQTRNDRQDF